MPGLIRDLDPEATARPLAHSASSAAPAASKQPPPRAPRSAGWQPMIDEVPGELARVNHAAPSPCPAPPPRALPRPTAPIAEDAKKKAAEKLKAPSPFPAPSSCPPFGPACPPQYTTTPTYYAPALLHSSRASSLFPKPYIPASVAVQLQQPHAAAEVLPYAPEGIQAAAGFCTKEEDQLYSSKEHPIRIRYDREQSSSQLVVEAALARRQRPMPYPKEGVQAAVEFKKRGGNQFRSSKERALLIREERVANLGARMSNPMEPDILESIATFGAKNSKEMDVIRNVLMILPEGPISMFKREQCSGGDDVACSDDACIHTYAGGAIIYNGDASATASKEPLILYDRDIVRAAKAIGARVNFAQIITDILHNHSGLVRYFRVDSFQLENGTEQLQEWFELLTTKQVKEVLFVNCRWPIDMFDFPLNHLDCESLEKISLCFVKISDVCLNYVNKLTTINLSWCSISTQDLFALAYQCKKLKELNIGFYEGDIIRINSESLEVLIIWNCTVRKVAIPNAVTLQRVLVAARPRKPALHVGIWIEDALALKDACFDLSSQSVSICNLKMKTDNAPLPNLRRLVLHFSFKVEKEKEALMNLLKSSMILEELILWRNDETYGFECLDALLDDWSAKLKGLPCLKLHLQVFMIKDFKGGDIEIAISSAILEHASYLQKLILQADSSQDDTIFVRANTNFEKIARASTSAVVKCEMGLSDD